MQVLSPNVKEILKIKNNFPNLSSKKIEEIYKTINELGKPKSHINMITKGLLCKQIIVPMSNDNLNKFMPFLSKYIVNINRALKNIKSDTIANFIYTNHCSLIITSNKIASQSDLSIIENYIKNTNFMNADDIISPHLFQSKSYLKILGIPYIIEETNTLINSSVVKSTIKSIYIFDNIYIVSKPHIIKVSPKSDMVIIWANIWNTQSGSSAKSLINRFFNIGSYITTIQGVNINLGISQCKNY